LSQKNAHKASISRVEDMAIRPQSLDLPGF
jgi:hypothetical protein